MKCCICGKKVEGWGNSPWPVSTEKEARCCDKCNMDKVIPARMKMLKMAEAEEKKA